MSTTTVTSYDEWGFESPFSSPAPRGEQAASTAADQFGQGSYEESWPEEAPGVPVSDFLRSDGFVDESLDYLIDQPEFPDSAGFEVGGEWEFEDAGCSTPGGRAELAKVAALRSHGGAPPALVMRWNAMADPTSIDVVVHLHGYSSAAAAMRLPRSIEPISGLDFGDPEHPASGVGRTRPTLMLLPRGRSEPSAKRPDRFTFPALIAKGAIRALVAEAMAVFREQTCITAPVGRLILTAHSGGGAPLNQVVGDADPDEVIVYDGLYGPGDGIAAWAVRRIRRDVASPAATPPALRILFGTGTAASSRKVAAALRSALAEPGAERLAMRFRVEQTSAAHPTLPRRFGWRLLADITADVGATPLYRAEGRTGREAEIKEAHEAEIGAWEHAGFAPEELEPLLEGEDLGYPDHDEAWTAQDENSAPTTIQTGFEPEDGLATEETLTEELGNWGDAEFMAWEAPAGGEATASDEAWTTDEASATDEAWEWGGEEIPRPEGEDFPSGVGLTPATGATGKGQEHWDPNTTGLPLLQTGPDTHRTKLSADFAVKELVTSGGIAAPVARISPKLVKLLQAMRDRAGKPIRIDSGYRSWARNATVYQARGQRPTYSRHCSGQAADIRIAGLTGVQIAKLALDVGGPNLGVGIGGGYAHVDVRPTWAVWTYLSGQADTQAKGEVSAHRQALLRLPARAQQPVYRDAEPPQQKPAVTATTDSPDRRAGVVQQLQWSHDADQETPGARAVRTQWKRLTGREGESLVHRAIKGTTRRSVHAEGRAVDLYASAVKPDERSQAETYIAWLVQNSLELQVAYIIWNRRQWSWPRRAAGWRPYEGSNPHTNHIHMELSPEGARTPSPLFATGVSGLGGTFGLPSTPAPPPQIPSGRQPSAPAGGSPVPSGIELTPARFIAAYGQHARATEATSRVPALVTLAQAAFESGWGAKAAGYNFFGIKARPTDPEGTKQLWITHEVHKTPNVTSYPEVISVTQRPDGKWYYVVRAWFRVFPDVRAAFEAHSKTLLLPRYAGAFAALPDPYAFATGVAQGGYATAPDYAQSLHRIMRTLERAGWK